MADYLRSEFLARLPDGMVSFLTRTAVLDRLSGSLCDAVLNRSGSAPVLDALESSNLLLVPLDDHRGWYRYHHLFRELLNAELTRQEPTLIPELHSRAAAWFEAHGNAEAAIAHAQAAGDVDLAARLVTAHAQPAYAAGRVDTARRWLAWFSDHQLLARYPQIAFLGGQVEAVIGHPAAAEHWADAAEHGRLDGAKPADGPFDGWLSYLRALQARRAWRRCAPTRNWR